MKIVRAKKGREEKKMEPQQQRAQPSVPDVLGGVKLVLEPFLFFKRPFESVLGACKELLGSSRERQNRSCGS